MAQNISLPPSRKLGKIVDELNELKYLFTTLFRSEESKKDIPFGCNDLYLISLMDSKLEKELNEIEKLQKEFIKKERENSYV